MNNNLENFLTYLNADKYWNSDTLYLSSSALIKINKAGKL